jgi:hypothetical protein
MYRITLLDGTNEYWNERIIQKIIPLQNGNWNIFYSEKWNMEIKSFNKLKD